MFPGYKGKVFTPCVWDDIDRIVGKHSSHSHNNKPIPVSMHILCCVCVVAVYERYFSGSVWNEVSCQRRRKNCWKKRVQLDIFSQEFDSFQRRRRFHFTAVSRRASPLTVNLFGHCQKTSPQLEQPRLTQDSGISTIPLMRRCRTLTCRPEHTHFHISLSQSVWCSQSHRDSSLGATGVWVSEYNFITTAVTGRVLSCPTLGVFYSAG